MTSDVRDRSDTLVAMQTGRDLVAAIPLEEFDPDGWHEGVFALAGSQRFFDKQGAVHAGVSVDFPRAFGCLLEVNLEAADQR
jgi:hypothetical protein